jgi:hypothetical protein
MYRGAGGWTHQERRAAPTVLFYALMSQKKTAARSFPIIVLNRDLPDNFV